MRVIAPEELEGFSPGLNGAKDKASLGGLLFYCPGGAEEFSPGLNGTKLRRMWAIYFVLASPQNPAQFSCSLP